jgi:precorrin-3B synthase
VDSAGTAGRSAEWDAAFVTLADRRRGACPTLSQPMQTGDGLLVRLRPVTPGLSPEQLIALAQAARRHGNGILDITARGNLQIRGLSLETVGPLANDITDAGIVPAQGLAIETPPLAGYDPSELCDPLPLAGALRSAVETAFPPLVLAPKLSVIIDGGGQLDLAAAVSDIRLTAEVNDGKLLWRLAVAGNAQSAIRISLLPTQAVIAAVMDVLRRLSALGPRARGRDLVATEFASDEKVVAEPRSPRHPAGLHALGPGCVAFGVALAFGQIEAEALIAFVQETKSLGARELRLAPDHALLALGIPEDAADAFYRCAIRLGLRPDPKDKGHHVAVCAGKGACASAMVDTKQVARLIISDAPALLDGSFAVHVSGCAKGCAHPASAPLTFVGAPTGYGLVVNGPASTLPGVYIEEKKLDEALSRLDALVRSEKHAGESARACLTRLGASRIIAAVQQG